MIESMADRTKPWIPLDPEPVFPRFTNKCRVCALGCDGQRWVGWGGLGWVGVQKGKMGFTCFWLAGWLADQ